MTRIVIGVVSVLAVVASAPAVQPAVWSHRTEADFAVGKLDKAVLNSLGELALARKTETLLAPDGKLGMISAAAVDGGKVYVATAPGGKIYRVTKGKAVELAELPATLVRCLRFDKDGLLAGVSGEKAGLYRIGAKGKVAPVWTDEEVTYVWAVVPAAPGQWYVATGAAGKVYHVRGGEGKVIYDGDDENVLSLALGADGGLYAGTGEKGLIVRIDPAGKGSRIVYDAPESEISTLIAAADGS
ncbi:MAG: SMP-30/gluconolactonase/LRE family protein, partial [Planctomycetota bacterium]